MNSFRILGLDSSATAEEVMARYRALAKKRHPDVGGSIAAMQELNAARDAALRAIEGQPENGASLFGTVFRDFKRPPKMRRSYR